MISRDVGLRPASRLTAPRLFPAPPRAWAIRSQAAVSARNSAAAASKVAVAVYRPEAKRPRGGPDRRQRGPPPPRGTLSHLLGAESYERPQRAPETLSPPLGATWPTACGFAQDPGVCVEGREAPEPGPLQTDTRAGPRFP